MKRENFIINCIVDQSLYEGSLCNYKLSPTSNISNFIDEDAQMSSPPKYAAPQDKTDNVSDDKISCIRISLSLFGTINFMILEHFNF